MVKLIAKSPCDGLLPITIAGTTLSEPAPQPMALIAPFHGQMPQVNGLTLPDAGQTTGSDDQRLIWFGRGQFLYIGAVPSTITGAAVTDQSDGWAVVRLSGPNHLDILARLVPIDLRETAFPSGATARTQLQHMSVCLTRIDPQTIEIFAMRSMAATLVHDISEAMQGLANRP